MLVLGSSVLLAFFAPEEYASAVRIKVKPTASERTPESYQRYVVRSYDPYFIRNQFEVIQSESVLGRVSKKLNLAESWGKTSAGAAAPSEADTIKRLKQKLQLRPVGRTSLMEVRVYSRNPEEASNIANVLVETYREFRSGRAGVAAPTSPSVLMCDIAVPGLKPARPNKPLTLALGLFGGILLALVVGGVGAFLMLLNRGVPRTAATTA